jgi:hypothetical protein
MMPDNMERKDLKKKMLDRWENEGGRIAADPLIVNRGDLASLYEGEGTQPRVSNNSSRVDTISSQRSGTPAGSVMI